MSLARHARHDPRQARSGSRPPCPRRRLAGAIAVSALAVVLSACGAHHRWHHGFTSDVTTIQIVTTQVGGKNVYIPSTIVVTSGTPHTLSFFNTTDIPHGFSIPALGFEAVIPPQQEYTVELPALEGNQVLQIKCQLHPAHRTGTLVVLPARKPR